MSKTTLTNPAVIESDGIDIKIRKHNASTMIMHGCVASGFIICGISGIVLWLGGDDAMRGMISHLHWIAGILFFFAPIIYIVSNFKKFARFTDQVTTFGKRDWGWLLVPFGGYPAEHLNLLRKNKKHPYVPPQDKYNAGQKAAALVLMFGSLVLGVSGLIMVADGGSLIALTPAMTWLIWRIHLIAAIITILVFLVHFYLSAIWPANRKGEFGSMWKDGQADYEFTAEEHGEWLNTLEIIGERTVARQKPHK